MAKAASREVIVTEGDWLKCKEPDAMLEHVRGWATDRQFRLFLCACIRRLLPALAKRKNQREICEKAIAAGEAYVDGRLSRAELVATLTVQDYLRSGLGPPIWRPRPPDESPALTWWTRTGLCGGGAMSSRIPHRRGRSLRGISRERCCVMRCGKRIGSWAVQKSAPRQSRKRKCRSHFSTTYSAIRFCQSLRRPKRRRDGSAGSVF